MCELWQWFKENQVKGNCSLALRGKPVRGMWHQGHLEFRGTRSKTYSPETEISHPLGQFRMVYDSIYFSS